MTQEIYISALDWLGRGFSLLPIYPGTKYILEGFGIDVSIKDQATAAAFFRDSLARYNLAVVAPAGTIILDFEDWDFYCRWIKFVKRFDDAITTTYTELTPRGGAHVFLSGELPACYTCRHGVEIKRHAVVSPSFVRSGWYEVFNNGPIYSGSLDAALFPLLLPCPDSAVQLVHQLRKDPGVNHGLISKIKLSLSIVDLFKKYYPRTKLKQRGHYYNSSCPFHPDKNPSFYINTQLNIFGCHACNARGDVINFYALTNKITNQQAVRDLMIHVC